MDIDKIIAKVTEEVMRNIELQSDVKNQFETPVQDIHSKFEHSMLDPAITADRIIKACAEARSYRLANICVTPYFVPLAAEQLRDSGVGVCSVCGFPQGASSTASKITEIRECIGNGATEMDMGINIVAIKSGKYDDARKDLDLMISAAAGKIKTKAIYEQCLYTDEEKEKVLTMIKASGADMVKISNALSGKKAEEADVKFVRAIVGRSLGIKIDGGVKTLEKALSLFDAGATRIGLTSALKICDEADKVLRQNR